jgi:hypothetical protein
MSVFRTKRGDLLPIIQGTCTDVNGPVDLTNATSVRFLMKSSAGVAKVTSAAAFVDRPNGVVSYTWAGTDTDTVGDYTAEFEVTWPGAKPETFPNRGYITVSIFQDLG